MHPTTKYPQVEKVKNQIIDTALFLGTILGIIAYGLSLTRYLKSGFEITFVTDLIVIVVLVTVTSLRKKIELKNKSYVALGAIFLLFIVDAINLGVFSANKVLIILIPFAALMSLSLRKAILIYLLAVLSLILLAYFHQTGYLIAPPQDKITYTAWIINIILISVVAIVLVLVHVRFNNAYSDVISNLEESNRIISEKERNYREIFNTSADAIFIHDLNGNILDVNDSMLQMYGYTGEEVSKLSLADLSSQKKGYEQIDAAKYFLKVNDNIPQVFDWQAKRKNGNHFWVEVALKKTVINNNDRILAIVRDTNEKKENALQLDLYRNHLEDLVSSRTNELKQAITSLEIKNNELQEKNQIINSQNHELKTTMEALKETQTQLIQTEKMASLGTLTAGIAHEINNPLNFIYNGTAAVELILENKKDCDYQDIKPYIEAINVGSERIFNIVKSLNKFTVNEKLPFALVNINEVIENCLIMLKSQTDNRIEIIKTYSSGDSQIYANESQIHQAIINVLSNAVQAIEGKGKIRIETRMDQDQITIILSDTGTGISDEHLPRIFDPFFTTKSPDKATGLGLSITKSIVNNHNGTINCSSELGKGTTLLIKLPKKN